jgi:hypothetical protein
MELGRVKQGAAENDPIVKDIQHDDSTCQDQSRAGPNEQTGGSDGVGDCERRPERSADPTDTAVVPSDAVLD